MLKKIFCFAMVVVLLLGTVPCVFADVQATGEIVNTAETAQVSSEGYRDYLQSFSGAEYCSESVVISLKDAYAPQGETLSFVENKDGELSAIYVADGSCFSVPVMVPKTGFYQIQITYKTFEGKDIDMLCALYIDNKLPFASAKGLTLSRTWKDSEESSFSDEQGNEYRPIQVEEHIWTTSYLSAKDEPIDGGYQFYLTAGEHVITFECVQEGLIVGGVTFGQSPAVPMYQDYIAAHEAQGHKLEKIEAEPQYIQAEDAVLKSHPTLYPIADYSSCITQPYDVYKTLLNTIGGENWSGKGQWIEWSIDVKESAFYQLAFRYKQNYKSGTYSVRQLSVDGKVPFVEAQAVAFNYDLGWCVSRLGEETPTYIYLEKGPHTLRMEVVYGPFADICEDVQSCVEQLNVLYRKVMMITGSSPDTLRDYDIGKLIPDCEKICADISNRLNIALEKLVKTTGERGSETAILDKTIQQLNDFVKDVETIPQRLSTFNSNISSLASWLNSIAKQPLLLDYLHLAPIETELPAVDAPWYRALANEFMRFFCSFVEDYDNIRPPVETNQDPIDLWLSVGRDQAIVVQSLITSGFTNETGIPVNVRLIDMSVLMRAVAADKGPDLALYQDQSTAINYALRNALYDLSTFDDIDEVLPRFSKEAYRPFQLGDALYALPESVNYNVLFYRTDIMQELGLTVPHTWDELYEVLAVFQKNHLELGVISSFTTTTTTAMSSLFVSMLYQFGGRVYDDAGKVCLLDEPVAVDAFREFCELYTKYGLSLKVDLLTRFRTGEVPMVINNFSFANELMVSAPEVNGLWKMTLLPGVMQEDGSVNRSTQVTNTGTVMFSNAKNPQNTWKLMKWWTSRDAQVEYARQIEAALGRANRWTSANIAAMEGIAWSREDIGVIKEQLKFAKALPEVAGGYYTGRSVNNALRTVVNSNSSVKETLYEYVKDINEELAIKRRELGLE